MRMASNDELDGAMTRASVKAVEGGAIGLAVGLAGMAVLNRTSTWYRKLTQPLKALSVAMPIIGFMMVYGEEELLKIEREGHAAHEAKRVAEFRRLQAESAN